MKTGRKNNLKKNEFGTMVHGRRFGWFRKRRGDLVIDTKYDDGYPVIEKKYLGGELVSTTYFKKLQKRLDI